MEDDPTALIGGDKKRTAILVGVHLKKNDRLEAEESLHELALLAQTLFIQVEQTFLVSRSHIDSALVLGSGKAEEILRWIRVHPVDLILFDEPLSPVQGKNLRNLFNVRMLDRVELILHIFSLRAKTSEAKIQVELARLKYLLPRLVRMWGHFSRQTGGGSWLKGGGETQLEVDRRHIRVKIQSLTKKLEEIEKNRELQRKERLRKKYPLFSLVGYTNAGKSSLFNTLTHSQTLSASQLFCTLDSLSRKFILSQGRTAILTDTVGFVRKLPHFLVESFKATLEEVSEADCLIHVLDGSVKDLDKKIQTVNEVIFELKASRKPQLIAINKADLISEETRGNIAIHVKDGIFISALTGEGISLLREKMEEIIKRKYSRLSYFFPMDKVKIAQFLFSSEVAVLEKQYLEEGLFITAEVNEEIQGKIKDFEITYSEGTADEIG